MRAVLPWAPPGSIKGFAVDGPRPPFIDGETDFQVEIVDARGASRLMPPMFFVWRDTVTVDIEWDRERLAALLARLGADPVKDAERVLAGTAAIADFTDELYVDPERETDTAFVDRILPILLGEPPSPATKSRVLAMVSDGAPRERVIEAIVDSRVFRRAHSRGSGASM